MPVLLRYRDTAKHLRIEIFVDETSRSLCRKVAICNGKDLVDCDMQMLLPVICSETVEIGHIYLQKFRICLGVAASKKSFW